jgi:hypothetical protein
MQTQVILVAAVLLLALSYAVGILYGSHWAKAARYRKLAADFHAKAKTALTRETAKEFYELANHYSRRAEEATRIGHPLRSKG